MRRLLPLVLLVVLPGTAPAPDIYKSFLDESRPNHRAIKETLALIEQRPNDAALYNDLGCLIAWDGFWRDAIRTLDKAAQLDEKDSKPLFNAGLVQAWRGDWSAARSAFEKAVKRNPGNWPAWWMIGYSEERLGNTDAAVDAYKRSLRVDTSLFDVRKNPFAATTKLKGRVLLESYGARMTRAVMPQEEQLEEPDRIAGFFQRSKAPAAPGASAATPTPAAGPPAPGSGPVVTTVPPSSAAAARPTAAPPPASYAVVPAPAREGPPSAAPPAAPPPPSEPARRIPAPGPGAPAPSPTPHPPGG
ncbi:MAG TPA: tetratricopeptide repeat protein [Thermoanaerobaculia bacterium]|nr:tetratricopeptide repeat protein [Thermoanaerobaculia bacterium]